VTSLAFSAGGTWEAVGSADGAVRVWDARDGSFQYDLRRHEGAVQALGFSADESWLFSGGADRVIFVWDMRHGTMSANQPTFDRVDTIGTLAVGGRDGLIASASGPWASASLDHSVKLWQSHSDRPIRVLRGHAASVRSVAFTAGSDRLASASLDGTVKLWNSRNGECLRTVTNDVLTEAVAFLPGARWLVAGMSDGTVRVLDTNTLATAREWPAHQRPVQSLALSGDGRRLATASADATVAVWDFESGRELRRFTHVTA
jgi:WD40 repeat protein